MFERFTETAIQVILLAQEESRLLEDNLAKPNEVIFLDGQKFSLCQIFINFYHHYV